jgi:hypothetical protein
LDLGLKFDAVAFLDGCADPADELQHILAGSASTVDHEIAMHLRHFGTANAQALEAGDVDQAARVVPIGVLEHAAGTGFAGLGLLALGRETVHRGAHDLGSGAFARPQDGAHCDGVFQPGRVAVGGAKVLVVLLMEFAVERHVFHGLDQVEDPAAHGAGVHAQGSAHAGRNALGKLETLQAEACGFGANLLEARPRAHLQAAAAQVLDAREGLGRQADDEPREARVGHQQV